MYFSVNVVFFNNIVIKSDYTHRSEGIILLIQ